MKVEGGGVGGMQATSGLSLPNSLVLYLLQKLLPEGEDEHNQMNRKARYSHIVCGIESFKIPAMFFGFCALEIKAKKKIFVSGK